MHIYIVFNSIAGCVKPHTPPTLARKAPPFSTNSRAEGVSSVFLNIITPVEKSSAEKGKEKRDPHC